MLQIIAPSALNFNRKNLDHYLDQFYLITILEKQNTLRLICIFFSLAWEEIPSTSKTMVVPIKMAAFPTVTLCPRNSNPDRWGPAIKIFDHLKRNCPTQRQEYLISYMVFCYQNCSDLL